jgi:hypothetical protein
LIALCKSAGFSLREMTAMFGRNGMPDLPRETLRAKAAEVGRRIDELTSLRETLRHIADCPAPSHLECPSFRKLLAQAGPAVA